ncbi:MAG: phosphomannomutase [Bdellovibrionota bacterium]
MASILISDLMDTSGVKFGTSGARGLADSITDRVAYVYTKGFLQYMLSLGFKKDKVAIAGDLRKSTPRIMKAVAKACVDSGFEVVGGEFAPSPAVAFYGIKNSIPAIMITGSHIPDDRNGIKYNLPTGEILKKDELGIKATRVEIDENLFENGNLKYTEELFENSDKIKNAYIDRYLNAFYKDALKNKKIVFYEHSGVGRDMLPYIYEKLGANVIRVGRSETFIPVDTEAVREEDLKLAKKWAKEYNPDIILSTDGDADRPLVFDENGNFISGDILGVLVASYLKANAVCAPVSANSVLETSQKFNIIKRTKIGSPFVIEAMQSLNDGKNIVVGYEANGGFLLETKVNIEGKELEALPTRDAAIVHLALLLLLNKNLSLSKIVSSLNARVAISNRVQNFETAKSKQIIEDLKNNLDDVKIKFPFLTSKIIKTDLTDGLRMYFEDDTIVHLRPSGNAPEFRCYVEASDSTQANTLLCSVIKRLTELK